MALALRARIRQLHGVWVALRFDRERELWVQRWTAHRVVSDAHGARVASVPFDALAQEYGIARVDRLKINIEGAEAAALTGMRQTLPIVRNIVVSCHDFIGHPTEAAVRRILSEHGFRIRERRPGDERPWARSWIYGTRN